MSTRQTGASGEDLAEQFLVNKGFNILGRNMHVRFSEIDILAELCGVMVIIEVKAKRGTGFGAAVEQVTRVKKERLARLADLLQVEYNKPVRVDVIAIDNFGSISPVITHYENALE